MLRILHYIHSLRFFYLDTPIVIGKYDFKAAYKGFTLWLTFDGSPCPLKWCPMAEIITDLTNNILECEEWNVMKIYSSHSKSTPESQPILPNNILFGKVLPADVYVHPKLVGNVDGYIDDSTPVTLHHNNNTLCTATAVPRVMCILGRPVLQSELVPRNKLIHFRK